MADGAANITRPVHVRELTVPADDTQLGRVRDFIVEVCDAAGLSQRETSNTKLAVDEACTNIIKHAYGGQADRGDIRIRCEVSAGEVRITLHDSGKRFDFAGVQDPDLDQYVETGRKGGLGVYLINRLMDGVEYRAGERGNELILTKRTQSAAMSRVLIEKQPFRGTLRYKFTLRAAGGLFVLMAVLWGFMFVRQTHDIAAQKTTQWLEKRRLAESVANRSVDVLSRNDEYSVEQTNMSAFLSKLVEGGHELAYARLVDAGGRIVASGDIQEMFTPYRELHGKVLLHDDKATWTRVRVGGHEVRDIGIPVRIKNAAAGGTLDLGTVHLGVYEDAVNAAVEDNRLQTSLLLFSLFLVGVLLIIGLVQVFVKPIQVLTDGVRAIGDGNLDGKLDVQGPAEIGAIAAVFNEITDKFKKAQNSILEQEKMQKEMEVAKEIQQSLLPRKRPEVSGYDIAPLYQAAAEVGGDYYDFVQVDEDTIGVVVADVSGKGVPGSLVMTMIRTALRMEARGNKNASDVMSKMNAFVTDDMKKGMFVTMFYVILDSKNRIISYASAGHNPMILFRAETNETFFLNPKGFPVGISLPDEELFRKSISLEKIKLKKDDMLLIYTDGVTEAMNERRDQYGEERLIAAVKRWGKLPPDDFIERLEGDIKKFTAGYPQNDDITVVAVKEKLTADDVLFGIRKKLIEMVDIQGMSVKEACERMRVSAATYYRYKKRLEIMGERGLKNKVLRQDVTLKRLSLEARKAILGVVAEHPEYGAKRLAEDYNAGRPESHHVTERMVYDELKRLNLNTKELRIDYLRRNRLLREEDETVIDKRASRQIVEELLRDIPGVDLEGRPGGEVAAGGPPAEEAATSAEDAFDFDRIDGVGIAASTSGGVTELRVNGHIDSVTSSSLEEELKRLIEQGMHQIVVNLADVTYISSGGWGIFSGEVRSLREQGGDVILVGMTSEVYDVYELLGFADILRAFRTTDEARDYFRLSPEERFVRPAPRPVETSAEEELESVVDEAAWEGGPGPEWESLRIEATTVGENADIAVISLRGIIDTVSAENLRSALDKVITRGIYKIVADMSGVEYVSSGGWGTFTERLREVRRRGGDVKLFGMDPDVYYVFTMLGFNIVLSSFDILADAIEDFARGATTMADPEERPVHGPRTDAGAEAPPARREREPGPAPIDLERLAQERGGHVVTWDHTEGGVAIARLHGPIEAAASTVLSQALDERLREHPRAFLFDFSDVPYVSSTGWGQVAHCYEMMRERGGVVAVFGLGPELHDVYSLLEFHALVREYPTESDALHALRAAAAEAPPRREEPAPPDVAREEPARDDAVVFDADRAQDDGGSVDDILADAPSLDESPPAEPSTPEVQHWPGERAAPGAPAESGEPGAPEDTTEAETSREEEPADSSLDTPANPDEVDVHSALTDSSVDRDEHIRKMGWGEYGERLRERQDKKRNRKKEDDE